jgi:hypothetical protein
VESQSGISTDTIGMIGFALSLGTNRDMPGLLLLVDGKFSSILVPVSLGFS